MIKTGAELVAALADHSPVDLREQQSLRRLRGLVAWLPRPFEEEADPTHVTVAGIVVDEAGRLLLHRHKRLGTWLQPGGHVEPGEGLESGAEREVHEETGLAVTLLQLAPLHVDVHEGPRGHVHLDVRFLFGARARDPLRPGPDESPVIEWFEPAQAAGIVDGGLRGVLECLPAGWSGHHTAR